MQTYLFIMNDVEVFHWIGKQIVQILKDVLCEQVGRRQSTISMHKEYSFMPSMKLKGDQKHTAIHVTVSGESMFIRLVFARRLRL